MSPEVTTDDAPTAARERDDSERLAAAPTGAAGSMKLLVALGFGVLVGVLSSLPWTWRQGALAGWIAGAVLYLGWTWSTVWPMDARRTAGHALREDPNVKAADVTAIIAAVASLFAVGLLLSGSTSSGSGGKFGQAGITVVSVAMAWAVVHTNFTLRYARLFYTGKDGGIDFNEDDAPQYTDFAYLAFTVGMTFQVSDTDLQTKSIRATALKHALLSYLFGVVIIASVINLVAGLTK